MPRERAFLGARGSGGWLPFNPDSVRYGYKLNQAARDTLGGRVLQNLSVSVDDMTVEGVAGSRRALLDVAKIVRECMAFHINQQLPVHFRVPSRRWDFLVYARAMPEIRWDLTSVEFPYRLTLAVQEDLGVATPVILRKELARLQRGIGYNDAFSGGDPKGAAKIVSWIIDQYGGAIEGAAGGGGGGTGGSPDISGRTIRQKIFTGFSSVFGERTGNIAVCIAEHESGFNPRAINSYVAGGVRHFVRGLFQISDIHRANAWYPNSDMDLFDPDTNIECAIRLYKQVGERWTPWSVADSCAGAL